MDYNKLSDLLYPNTHDTIADLMQRYPARQTAGEVTRFAPSPTGYLHIGSFFGAYIDYLIAKQTGGVFYLRLEDTDQKRLVEGSDMIALNMLRLYDVMPDEGYKIGGDYGPYQQSQRTEIYNVFAKELVRLGRAMPCFCGENGGKAEIMERRETTFEADDPCMHLTLDEIAQKINAGQKFALRFISQGNVENKTKHRDIIKGEREVSENDQNAILIKSNGIPVYAFAHLVDDTLMHTSIVVRGEEWYSSLPVHLELFKSLGIEPPKYAHTPILMKTDASTGNKRKISKRYDPEADMRYFFQQGYPIDAIKEYLLTLINSDFEPWRLANPTAPIEDYPFDMHNIGTSNPYFDMDKLDNISKRVISTYSAEQVYDAVVEYAQTYDPDFYHELTTHHDRWLTAFAIDRGGDKPRKDIYNWSMVKSYFDYLHTDWSLDKSLLDTTLELKIVKDYDYSNDIKIDNILDDNYYINYIHIYQTKLTTHTDNADWFAHLKDIALANGFADRKDYKANPQAYLGDVTRAATLIRLAITGKTNTPSLYDIMSLLGVEECARRLDHFISLF